MAEIIVTEKPCTTCKKLLPANQFHRVQQTKHGLSHQCKECRKPYTNAVCVWEPSQPDERWEYIPDTEDSYSISTLGRVRRNKSMAGCTAGKILSQDLDRAGYYRCHLSVNGKVSNHLIHRLVALAFIPRTNPDRVFVNHIDGTRTNNCVENLEWVTHQENCYHASHVLKRYPRQSAHKMAKLNEWQVRVIRRLVETKLITRKTIASFFHVSKATIDAIAARRLWRSLV